MSFEGSCGSNRSVSYFSSSQVNPRTLVSKLALPSVTFLAIVLTGFDVKIEPKELTIAVAFSFLRRSGIYLVKIRLIASNYR